MYFPRGRESGEFPPTWTDFRASSSRWNDSVYPTFYEVHIKQYLVKSTLISTRTLSGNEFSRNTKVHHLDDEVGIKEAKVLRL